MVDKKKLPSAMSVEELLNVVGNATPVVSHGKAPRKETSVFKFLNTFQIEPGNFTIDRQVLYKLYRQFEHKFDSNIHMLHTKFYKKIESYLRCDKHLVYINQKSLDLGDKVISLLEPKKIRDPLKTIPLQKHFNSFIKRHDIKPGKGSNSIWVNIDALYDLYNRWVFKIRKKRPMDYNKFLKFCKLYFSSARKDHFSKTWISLDDSITSRIEPSAKTKQKPQK